MNWVTQPLAPLIQEIGQILAGMLYASEEQRDFVSLVRFTLKACCASSGAVIKFFGPVPPMCQSGR